MGGFFPKLGLSSPRSVLCYGLPADCRCGRAGLRAVGLTRSREAAKGNAEVGVWCLFSRAADGSSSAGSFRSSGFPARDPSSATGCLQIAAAGRRVCVPWASREAAKPRMEMQRWVFGVRLAKLRTGVRGWVLSEARAFQPEISPQRLAACRLPLRGGGFCVTWASREAAKGNAEVGGWCSVSQAADGSPWVGSFRSSGFPARDLSSATGCPQIAAAGRRVCLPWASREAAKPRMEMQRWVFSVRLAKLRTGVRGWVLSVARAFQPEICPPRRAARR